MDIENVTDWESRALAAERELKFRELHHAEVEQENARLEHDNEELLRKYRQREEIISELHHCETDDAPRPVEFDPPLTDAESAAYWAAINDDPEPTEQEQS